MTGVQTCALPISLLFTPVIKTVAVLPKRMLVRDSDQAPELEQEITQLRALVEAFKRGRIKEVY